MNLLTVCVTAKAEDVTLARPLCFDWVKTQGRTGQTVEQMLPTPLSPSGQNPPTHWLCSTQLTQAQLEHMQAFIVAHQVPVVASLAGSQAGDGTQFRDPNRDIWLVANNLRIVE